MFVILHVWALHVTGQTNPTGVEVKSKTDTVPFTPYATLKDALGVVIFLLAYCWFVFYMPNYLGHPDNYTMANALKTPAHIVRNGIYLPFYAMLRAITFNIWFIDSKLGGVLVMFVDHRAFLPALARYVEGSLCRLSSVVQAVLLALRRRLHPARLLGSRQRPTTYTLMAQFGTLYYFGFFLVIMRFSA